MANEIKDKFSTTTAMTITLTSLASSTAGAGRQSTLIDNATARYRDVIVYVETKLSGTPTADKSVMVYGLRGDDDATSEHITDGAGTTDQNFTIKNAPLIGVIGIGSSPGADVVYGEFLFHRPGPTWGICIVQDTGQNLSATAGDHVVRYIGLNPEVQ